MTICKKNIFNTDYAVDLFKSYIKKFRLPDLFNYTELMSLSFQDRKGIFSGLLYTVNDKIGAFSDTEKKKLGHDLEDILIECVFNNIECRHDDFVWYFDKLYGKLVKYLFLDFELTSQFLFFYSFIKLL